MSKLSPLILLMPSLAWPYPVAGLNQMFQLQYSIVLILIFMCLLLTGLIIRALVLHRTRYAAEVLEIRRSLKKLFFLRPFVQRRSQPRSSEIKPTENGFSLAEVMVTAGLLAGLSLVVMQITKNQQQTINFAESKSEELELYNRIRVALLQKDVCEATFGGSSLNSNLTRIQQPSGTDLYVVGNEYGNRALRLTGLRLNNQTVPAGGGTGTVNLRVTTERLKPGMRPPAPRDISLTVTTNTSGQVTECFADTEGTILTSKEEMCLALGGVFDQIQNQCALTAYPDPSPIDHHGASTEYVQDALTDFESGLMDNFLPLTGGTLTGELIVQDNIQATGLANASSFCINGDCRTTFALQECAPGSVVSRISPSGTVTCRSLTCPANQFFAGLSAGGAAICRPFPTRTCPTNQYVDEVRADGTVVCKSVPYHWAVNCSPGTVIRSVGTSGTPICTTLSWDNISDKPVTASRWPHWNELQSFPATCPEGKILRGFNPSGGLVCVDQPTIETKYGCVVLRPTTPATPEAYLQHGEIYIRKNAGPDTIFQCLDGFVKFYNLD